MLAESDGCAGCFFPRPCAGTVFFDPFFGKPRAIFIPAGLDLLIPSSGGVIQRIHHAIAVDVPKRFPRRSFCRWCCRWLKTLGGGFARLAGALAKRGCCFDGWSRSRLFLKRF